MGWGSSGCWPRSATWASAGPPASTSPARRRACWPTAPQLGADRLRLAGHRPGGRGHRPAGPRRLQRRGQRRASWWQPRLVQATVASDGQADPGAAPGRPPGDPRRPPTPSSPRCSSRWWRRGPAPAPSIPGYTVAGKTGTAQIPDRRAGRLRHRGLHGHLRRVSPRPPTRCWPAIVVLDRPTPIFGGTVAAPVFSQIMGYALHRYDIPTTPGRPPRRPRRGQRPRPDTGRHVSTGGRASARVPSAGRRRRRGGSGRSRPRPAHPTRADEPVARRDRRGRDDGRPLGRRRARHRPRQPAGGPGRPLLLPARAGSPTATTTPAEAVARGAVGLLCERPCRPAAGRWSQARVAPGRVRPAMARVAAAFYGHPSRDLRDGRGHRDQRQDHGDPPARRGARRGRPPHHGDRAR